eukprot:scaffold688_cov105-Cylindrotheca_fusiformis.AAC.5
MHSVRMLALRLLLPPVHRCLSSKSDSRVSSHASAEWRFQGRLDSKYSDAAKVSLYIRLLRLAQTHANDSFPSTEFKGLLEVEERKRPDQDKQFG